MDQLKIGSFIAERRKAQNLTQMQLAEKLNITDRAVSKWETGRSLPDASLMTELCEILNITLIDLFSGEVVTMGDYNKELEKKLLEMTKQKEVADRQMLHIEIAIGVICILLMLVLTMVASLVQMDEWLRILLIIIGLVPILVASPFMLKIEQVAGYYKCKKCGHTYVPTFKAINLAMHMGRTRYMRCPECHKKSWQKKVISKED